MAITKDDVKEFIKEMKVKDLADLISELEEELGVSAAAPVAVAVAGAPAAGGGDAEEQTEFSVFITSVGQQKIQVIKAVKEITGLGLKEAKELAEKEGSAVKEKISKEDAEKLREKLEGVGATVDIK